MGESQLLQTLNEQIKSAMKGGRRDEVGVLRLIKSNLQNALLVKRDDFSKQDEIALLTAESKRRRESIELYEKGGRQDLADKEKFELELIATFLPKPLSKLEVEQLIKEAVTATGAKSTKDLGRVMGQIMTQVKGRADGKTVQEMVRKRLEDGEEA